MLYNEKKEEVAKSLFALLHKGDLLRNDGEIVKHKGLSSGEQLIYEVCCAIAKPDQHRFPALDDLANSLSENYRVKILLALKTLFDLDKPN